MNPINTILQKVDYWQQSHRLPGFLYAVVKKYGDEQAGYQAALLTYYAFLSLFPLLLVLTTVTGLLHTSHPALQQQILHATTKYFPSFGSQLSSRNLHKSGVTLVIATLFTLYGARGVADAFRNGINHVWGVSLRHRDGFPKSIFKSLTIVIVGGIGLIAAAGLTSLAAGAGHGFIFRGLPILVNIGILFALFSWLINISLPEHVSMKDIRSGALTAAIGLVLLQAFGTYLLKRELKSLDAVNANFAIALGLLFWLYLQAQVLYYSVTVACVHTQRLWPRSIISKPPTKTDKIVRQELSERT